MKSFFSDLRHTLNLIRRQYASSSFAILVMSIGLGVALTVFTFVNGVLWSEIGVKAEDELLHVEWNDREGLRNIRIRLYEFQAFRSEASSFKQIAAFNGNFPAFHNPNGEAFTERYRGAQITPNFFTTIGQKPLHGEDFRPEDADLDAELKIIISHRVWEEQFDLDPAAIGSTILINGNPTVVIGIMPKGFAFPGSQDLWFPQEWRNLESNPLNRHPSLSIIATLKEGAALERAQTELDTIAKRLASEHPKENELKTSVEIKPYYLEVVGSGFRSMMLIMLAFAVVVLLVACANVSNLIMARAAKRASELSIRSALGASRSRILYQVMLDGFVICGISSAFGLALAFAGTKRIWSEVSVYDLPYWWHMNIDANVVIATLGFMFLASTLSSLIPALRASRPNNYEILKDDSRTSSNLYIGALSKALTGFQILLSTALLLTALVMVFLGREVRNRPWPIDAEHSLAIPIRMNSSAGFESEESVYQFYEQFQRQMVGQMGVEHVGWTNAWGGIYSPQEQFEIEGELYEKEDDRPNTIFNIVSQSYFEVFDVQPVIGRLFRKTDTKDNQLVCVVNKPWVEAYLDGKDPIGKRIKIFTRGNPWEEKQEDPWLTIVGVVPNLEPPPLPGQEYSNYAEVFVPFQQRFNRGLHIVMSGRGDPHLWIPTARKLLRDLAPNLAPQGEIRTLRETIDFGNAGINVITTLYGVFGIAALVMAFIGLYSVINFMTTQRTREIGIRMALGADLAKVLQLILKQAALIIGIGFTLGMGLGHFLSDIVKDNFWDSWPIDYSAYGAVAIVILLACALALIIPSSRAARLDPSKALRTE